MSVHIVYPHGVDEKWRAIAPLFQMAIDRCGDDLTTGELWQMCRTGHAYLVIALDEDRIVAASAWRFEKWGKGPVFRCLCLGGSQMDDWLQDGLQLINKMMRDGGTDRLVADGRTGWTRILKQFRARILRVTFEVRL